MQLARVIGTVVATRKYEGLEGCKLLLLLPLDHALAPTGDPLVAVDTVRAGPGDLVYLVGSREAALALEPWFVPVDAAIVGIVDDLDARHGRDEVGRVFIADRPALEKPAQAPSQATPRRRARTQGATRT